MNTRKNTVLLISVLVLGLASLVLAGVDPEPFNWLIIKLGSVENVLSAVDYKLEKILAVPPEPVHPPEPCKLARKLNTIADRLNRQNNRVIAVIDAFPEGHPPDPCIDPLSNVRVKAQSIVETLRDGYPPDPCRDVEAALAAVNAAANAIIETIDAVYPDRLPN